MSLRSLLLSKTSGSQNKEEKQMACSLVRETREARTPEWNYNHSKFCWARVPRWNGQHQSGRCCLPFCHYLWVVLGSPGLLQITHHMVSRKKNSHRPQHLSLLLHHAEGHVYEMQILLPGVTSHWWNKRLPTPEHFTSGRRRERQQIRLWVCLYFLYVFHVLSILHNS